jgi:hypothetical protein
MVGGWHVRNYLVAGVTDFSSIAPLSMFYYKASGAIMERDRVSLAEAQAKLNRDLPPPLQRISKWKTPSLEEDGISLPEKNRILMEKGARIVKENAYYYGIVVGKGSLELFKYGAMLSHHFFGLSTVEVAKQDLRSLPSGAFLRKWVLNRDLSFPAYTCLMLAFAGVFVLFLGCVVTGVVFGLKDADAVGVLLLLGIIAYFVVLSAGPETAPRFRISFESLLCVFAGLGGERILSFAARLRRGLRPAGEGSRSRGEDGGGEESRGAV